MNFEWCLLGVKSGSAWEEEREGGKSKIPERPGEILPRVLMDFGLFESLLAIKLTACCASSTAPLSSLFIPAQTTQADDTKGSAHVCLTTPPSHTHTFPMDKNNWKRSQKQVLPFGTYVGLVTNSSHTLPTDLKDSRTGRLSFLHSTS